MPELNGVTYAIDAGPGCTLGSDCLGRKPKDAGRTAAEFMKLTEGRHCPSCARLLVERLDLYEHDAGWDVVGFEHKMWLSRTCVACGYDASLNKLGVARP